MSEEQDGRKDFDFILGNWKVHNRRLRERLKGSTEWEEFEGELSTQPILGGLGNLEIVSMERGGRHIDGLTLRIYNPGSGQWSIYWADSIGAALLAPMVGSFKDGRGEFYDQELFEGKRIYSRFIWSDITPTSCKWAQAFSEDGGKTWETNWTTELTRK